MTGKKRLLCSLVSLLIILSLALSAGCANGAKSTFIVPAEAVSLTDNSAEEAAKTVVLKRFEDYPDDADRWLFLMGLPETGRGRKGAWVDEVLITAEPDAAQAAVKLGSGDIDTYAFSTYTSYSLLQDVVEHSEIDYTFSYGSYRDLRFNTYRDPDTKEPLFVDGRLNPFGVPETREAMNRLVDRETIVDTYMNGMGVPKWTVLGTQFLDHALYYEDIIADIEAAYAYNFTAAKAAFDTQMPLMGATWNEGEGLWYHGGEPVEIIFVIRSDLPPFPEAGYYVADQVEALGFEVTRLVMPQWQAFQIWVRGEPADGLFHIATGGWGGPTVPRNQGVVFDQMYTHRVMGDSGEDWRLWAILEEQLQEFPELDEASRRLRFSEYANYVERRALFDTALTEAMRFSNCVWLGDTYHVNAYRHDVRVAVDLAAGIVDPAWVHTVHFHDGGEPVLGGTLKMALHDFAEEPWNPVDGSPSWGVVNRRALGDAGTMLDPRDGLHHPHRIESAAITAWDQLPVRVTLPWVELSSVPDKITVPDTAWADWDAENGVFITAEERKAADPAWEQAANVKSVVVYPDHIYDVPLHDGSTLSLGDFVMSMIMRFDRGKPQSSVYDQSREWAVAAFLDSFKGVEIIHDGLGEEPLTIATYTDMWHLDAELNVTTWFPQYETRFTGFWHMITVGWLAEAGGDLAFSSWKAGVEGVPWMDYTRGPSLPVLKDYMDWAEGEGFIPYQPTLGDYISPAEAAERWANLQNWYDRIGHFWVGNGPFYLHSFATAVATATGTGPAFFTTSHGLIEDLQALPVPADPPDGYTFPDGLFSFKITGLASGQTVTVTIELPSAVPAGTKWWKHHDGQWHDYNIPITISGNTITITLTDGGVGDLDDVPGQITDPGGPGYPLSLGYTVGWETRPINKVAVMAPWIGLLAAIAGASLLVLRRRQTQS